MPQFVNHAINAPHALAPSFDVVGAVSRLREVRTRPGFARIEPYPISTEKVAAAIATGDVAPLSKAPLSWLMAAEIRGEAIYLRFRDDAVEDWIAANPAALERTAVLDTHSARVAAPIPDHLPPAAGAFLRPRDDPAALQFGHCAWVGPDRHLVS